MSSQSSQLKFALILFVGLLFIVQPLQAGRVLKVKGKKVYIKLNPDEVGTVTQGDALYLTTPAGKKRGLVTIRKMKGRNVIAQLRKGKAQKRMLTLLRKGKKTKRRMKEPMQDTIEVAEKSSSDSTERSDMMLGLLLTYGSASQEVANVADMSGSLIGFKAAFDYSIVGNLGVQARLGMDMLSVSGSDGATNYTTDINYITLDFFLRYYFMRSQSFGFFGHAGMGIYSPMSNDLGANAAIQEDSISTTSVGIIGGGISLPFGSWELQLGLDYYIFPPSDDVSTSVIGGRLGVFFDL
jgi:hypothetical protein